MGRIGVSYLQVANVASELQGRGINPTVDAVREVLRTGSRSTIGPYLKQWRDKQEVSGNTAALPPELSSLVKGLYDRLQAEADHRIEQETQRCEGLIEEEKRANELEINLLNHEINSLKQQGTVLQSQNTELSKKLESTLTEKEECKREWYEQKGRIMELQESIQRLQNERLSLVKEAVNLRATLKLSVNDAVA